MRRTLSLLAVGTVVSGLALAESWTGKLLDASCYDQQKKVAGCDATSKTTAFGIEAGGQFYKLDRSGNAKATAALKNRADRADPNKPQSPEVMAKVDGTEKSGTITVENIEVQ
jgi:hypothetical protein